MSKRSYLIALIKIDFGNKETSHWWMQRLTSVALVPLSFWLLVLLDLVFNANYQQTLVWLSAPINCLAMMLWTALVYYHAALGLQVVIADYVPAAGQQKAAILGVKLTMLVLALAAITALMQLFITGW